MRPERNDHEQQPVSGIDGVLCPVCGQVVADLPVLVHRVIGDDEERFRVCSTGCRENALRAKHVQTSLFGRDLRVWNQSTQAALDLPNRDDGDESGVRHDAAGHAQSQSDTGSG